MNPEWSAADAYRCHELGIPYGIPHSLPVAAGEEIDGPDAWQLIGLGYAVPVDDEARIRCGLSEEQIAVAKTAVDDLQKAFQKRVLKSRKKEAAAAEVQE